MKKQTAKLIPLLATGIMPPAAFTSAILSSSALAAPGDLDPAFGEVGRVGPILDGPAWSLEPLEDGSLLLAGGDMGFYYYWYYHGPTATDFVSLLSADGAISPGFTAANLDDTQVFDIVRQPDGQVVAVGRKVDANVTETQLVVFRLQADGPLDTTFGTDGVFALSVADHGDRHLATSVVLDPDGKIVVAGSSDDKAIVLRLLPDGSFDDAFGSSGIFVGPDTFDFSDDYAGARTTILRTADGGYRVTASNATGCQVFALTAGGAPDSAFGTSGVATVAASSEPSTSCNSIAAQPDGRILAVGSAAGRAFAARLLANGEPDPAFSADSVPDSMKDATAVAAGADGTIVVAGHGVSGAFIMRLLGSGELDALFGNAGATVIDLHSAGGTSPVVRDMTIGADGSVVVAGGDDISRKAFVAKLLGAGGGDSPGVLGIRERSSVSVDEGTEEVVVNVRRTGGASGTVSLAYETTMIDGQAAVDGEDYIGVAGRLTWPDGDMTEQQVYIPILADAVAEAPEQFGLRLSDVQGEAGFGSTWLNVWIAADGDPHGQIAFTDGVYNTDETGSVRVSVARNYYASGAVSVTVTPVAGTATAGADFVADPVTVSWADGDWDWKYATIPLVNDAEAEETESFTVELSGPAGGAVLGAASSATVRILSNDRPPREESGGGTSGYLSLLALSFASFLRRMLPRLRKQLAPMFRRWSI